MRRALYYARSECLPGIWYSLHRFTVSVFHSAASQPNAMVRLVSDLACTYETSSVDTGSCSANVAIAICNARFRSSFIFIKT
jgi:hypothetical protein